MMQRRPSLLWRSYRGRANDDSPLRRGFICESCTNIRIEVIDSRRAACPEYRGVVNLILAAIDLMLWHIPTDWAEQRFFRS